MIFAQIVDQVAEFLRFGWAFRYDTRQVVQDEIDDSLVHSTQSRIELDAVGGALHHTSGWVRLDQIQSLSTVELGVILAR